MSDKGKIEKREKYGKTQPEKRTKDNKHITQMWYHPTLPPPPTTTYPIFKPARNPYNCIGISGTLEK